MLKRMFNVPVLVVVFMLTYQLLVPIGSIRASADTGTMLPPSNLAYQSITPDDGKLTWSAVFGASGYQVYEIKDGQLIALGKTTGTSYELKDLLEGSYRYVVSTLSSQGESGPSAPVSAEISYPEMQTPTAFAATIQNGNDVVLRWETSSYAENYNIYQVLESGEKSLVASTNAQMYSFSNVDEGVYFYAISSNHQLYGESVVSSPISIEVVKPEMKAPTNLSFTIANVTDVTLKWQAAEFADSYSIYSVNNGQSELLQIVTGTSFTLKNLPAGDYVYQVFSNSSRFGRSVEGSEVAFSVQSIEMVAPENVTAKIQNTNDIVVSWTAVPYATGYKVYQIVDGEKVLKGTVTNTSYSASMLPGGDYLYEVHSYSDRFGESEKGSQVTFTIETVIVNPPSELTYKIQNGNDIVLSWKAAENATNYKVYQVVGDQKVLKSTVTGTTVSYTNMPAGNYKYEVHTNSNRFGESGESAVVSFVLDQVVLETPGNARYEIKNGNDLYLHWDSVEFANSYKIYQVVEGKKVLKTTVSSLATTLTNLAAGDYRYEIYAYNSRFGESPVGAVVDLPLVHPEMKAPANGTYTITGPAAFTLNWDTVEYANSYKVYLVIDGKKVLRSTVYTNKASYTNIAPGEYQYEIYSYSSRFGESKVGTFIKFTLSGETLATPENPNYTISNGNDITLKWNAVQYANNYKIYQSVDGEEVLLKTVTGTSTILTNVAEGEFRYSIKANSTLFGESPEGALVEGTLVHPDMAMPENASYTISNGNDITLKWNGVQYATAYQIYLVVDGEKQFVRKVTGTTSTFANMPAGDYEYVVHSYSDRFGESVEGSQLVFKLVHPVMQAPANHTESILNGNDIKLNWDASTYATNYKVYQKVDGVLELLNTLPATTRTITFANMPEGDYEYVVHSYSTRFGESPVGRKLVFTLVHPVMQAPANLTKSILNGNDIKLSWDASTYATNYKVYQKVDGELELINTLPLTTRTITYTNMPEGDYEYVVHSYSNRFGESPEGSKLEFPLVHPIMQAPVTLTKTILNGNDIKLNWDASTYATNYKVYQKVDEELVLLNTFPATTRTFTFTNMPEGDYEYVIHSYSNRFGESPEGSKLEFPLVHPIMQAPAKLTKSIVNGNDIKLSWDASTYATNYKVYQKVDGELVLLKTLPTTTRTITYTNMPEGDYEYVVHSYSSRFGESPEGSILAFNLTWPVVQAPVVSNRVENVNNFTLSWPAVTWADEYRVYKVTGSEKELVYKGKTLNHKVYNLSEGVHSYEVTALSTRFGESVPSNTIEETVVYPVMGVPVASLKLLSDTSARITWDFVTYANGYNIYEVIDGKPVLVAKNINNLSYTINNLTYANHLYYVTSYSNSFGESKPSETVLAKLIIDEEAPVTTVNAPTGWVNQDQLVELTATDNEVGVAHTYYSLNAGPIVEGTSVLVTQEGINKIVYNSIDKVGNMEEVKTALVNIDKTAPITLVNEIPTAAQSYTVELTASDGLSGVSKTYYSLNGSEYVEGTSIAVTDEGLNNISYYSVDAAGNKEASRMVEVNIDQTAPTTTADLPTTWVKEDVNVTLVATDDNSGVETTYYSINGSDFVEGTSLLVDKEGVNTISYYSVDLAGNKEDMRTAEVKLDKTAPITVSDVSDKWSKDSVLVSLSSEDKHSQVISTFYSINGAEYVEGTTFTVDREGVNYVSYYSVDAAGNVEEAKSVEVKIDKTAPTLLLGVKGEYELGETVTLNYLANDDLSGIAVEEVTFNGQTYKKGDQVTLNQPGEYKLSVKVTDAAGWSTVVEKSIVVYIPVSLEVLPRVIKGNKGIFTVKATLPKEFQSYTFNVSTVTLDGVSPITDNNGLYKQAEKGHFKFERSDFTWTPGEAQLELRGYVGTYLVVGKASAIVKK
ncbi:OmpL47-type beta-barrel domain-containing protein [Robertmurraya korlensis]|uniref:OmpL47-type beta-barrel domain-containing protein n=1 Tax=Robertmurraya korlensis TaxID=519977 RepID=UPI0008248E7E|nr:hypothetical protein [Robertmurraya korlensis]